MKKCSLILLLALSSCTSSQKEPWYGKINNVSTNRSPAQEVKQSCWIDRFSIEEIKKEIKIIEAKWTSKKIEGEWNGINLANLNTPQGTYLKTYGDTIDQLPDQKLCTDLPCIINVLYGEPEREEGYRIYYWYLKTNTSIAVTDQIPDFKKIPNVTKNSYYFTLDELKAFNLIADLLPSRMKGLKLLKSIYSLPKGNLPDVNASGLTAGINIKYYESDPKKYIVDLNSSERIILSKLDTTIKSKILKGYFYNTLLHELGHATDFEFAFDHENRFSYLSEWNDLSWKFNEAFDVRTMNFKEAYFQKVNAEKFVTDYAGTSPAEDLAESIAVFRLDGEKIKTVSEKKYNILKERIFNQTAYDQEFILKNISNYFITEFQNNLMDQLESCFKAESTAQFQNSDSKIKECMFAKASRYVEFSLTELNINQYEGCKYKLADLSKSTLENNINETLEIKLNYAFNKLKRIDSDLFASWKNINQSISMKCNPLEIYFDVISDSDSANIYKNKLNACIQAQMALAGENQEYFYELLAPRFDSYDLTKIRELAETQINNILSGIEPSIKSDSALLWNKCKVTQKENIQESELLADPFNGKTQYVADEVLNCINQEIEPRLDFLIRAHIANIDQNPSTNSIKFAIQLKTAQYIQFLNNYLLDDAKQEKITVSLFRNAIILKSIEVAKESALFYKNNYGLVVNKKVFTDNCKIEMKKIIKNSIQIIFDMNRYDSKFTDFNQFADGELNGVCSDLYFSKQKEAGNETLNKAKDKVERLSDKANTVFQRLKNNIVTTWNSFKNWIGKLISD